MGYLTRGSALPLRVWVFEVVFLLCVVVRSSARATDYIRTPASASSKVLGYAEQVMPLDSWGWMFFLVAGLIGVGVIARLRTVLIIGCATGAVAYGFISVTMAVEVARLGDPLLRTPTDTTTTAILLAVLTVVHMIQLRADRVRDEVNSA